MRSKINLEKKKRFPKMSENAGTVTTDFDSEAFNGIFSKNIE